MAFPYTFSNWSSSLSMVVLFSLPSLRSLSHSPSFLPSLLIILPSSFSSSGMAIRIRSTPLIKTPSTDRPPIDGEEKDEKEGKRNSKPDIKQAPIHTKLHASKTVSCVFAPSSDSYYSLLFSIMKCNKQLRLMRIHFLSESEPCRWNSKQ